MNSNFFKTIVEKLPEGVLVTDLNEKIIYTNRKFERISGYKLSDLKVKKFSDIIKSTKNSCPSCEININDMDAQNTSAHQLGELKNKDKKLNCIRINQVATSDEYIIYTIIPLSEVAFLNQAHIDFVSTVSHELRTPLTSIKGFADTLLTAGSQLNEEQQTRFISIIKNQVDRLTRLVENLLTVSKLEAKQSKTIYKSIDFAKMLEVILCGIQPKAKEHKIKVNILPELPHIWADSDKLDQIMTNLIDNAVKYSNPGSTVTIEAGFVSENSDKVEIKVIDEGVGIPEEHLSKIFSKFSRIDNPLTRQVQGTGLGLYITKSLVESMGGEISVLNNGNGTTFIVKLPTTTLEQQTLLKFQESN